MFRSLFRSMECHQDVSLSSRKDPKDQQKRSSSIVTILQPRKSCSQPDSLYAYFVCFCGFLSILIAVGCSYSYGLIFPVLLDEFKEGKAKTAWVGSLAYASGSLFGPVVGALCDRFNHRSVAVSGSLIATAALAVTSQAPNLTTMYFTFGLVFGFGSCCIFFVVLTIMPRYFIKRRSLAAGLVLMGPGGGLIVMSPIIEALLSVTTWRVTFLVMAGMLLLTCILSCSFVTDIGNDNEECIKDIQRPGRSSTRLCATLDFSYLRNKEFVIYLIASTTCFCGITVPLIHMARYCQERGIDTKGTSMMYFWNGITSVLIRALTGYVCDIKGLHPKWIMQTAVFIAGATTALSTLLYSYRQLLACYVAYGVADGAIISSMNILAMTTLSAKQRSQGFGFFHFCVAIALAVGPPFGGFLADLSGSYVLTFYVAGSFHVLAGCIFFLSYCIKGAEVARENLNDLLQLEKFLIVETVTVL